MKIPEIKFADANGVSIAYQAFGNGERTVVGIPGFAQNIDLIWDDPYARRFFERVSAVCRTVHFDKRGTGLSERSLDHPSLDDRVEDVLAVMDAEGLERAVISGFSEGGTLAAYFAAAFPERTEALLLTGTAATYVHTEDHPWHRTRDELLDGYRAAAKIWGQGVITAERFAPSMKDDPRFREWAARYERQSISPAMIVPYAEYIMYIDIRKLLPTIRVPTLVIHAEGDRACPYECGQYLAEHIPGAKLVTLPTEDHAIWYRAQDQYLAAMTEFLVGTPAPSVIDRVLATVLFSDIVDSTKQASSLGDDGWRALLDKHDAAARAVIESWQGRTIKTTGDGVLATFDGPSRAVRAACDLVDRVRETTGLMIRVGLHCGEIERRGSDIAGIAVHVAARVQDLASPGGVTASRTVRDLTVGSGIQFADRGEHALKGIDDRMQLFDVAPREPIVMGG